MGSYLLASDIYWRVAIISRAFAIFASRSAFKSFSNA